MEWRWVHEIRHLEFKSIHTVLLAKVAIKQHTILCLEKEVSVVSLKHLGQVFFSDAHHHASAEFIGEFFNENNIRIGTT